MSNLEVKEDFRNKLKVIENLFNGYVNAFEAHKESHYKYQENRTFWRNRTIDAEKVVYAAIEYIQADGSISSDDLEESIENYSKGYLE